MLNISPISACELDNSNNIEPVLTNLQYKIFMKDIFPQVEMYRKKINF